MHACFNTKGSHNFIRTFIGNRFLNITLYIYYCGTIQQSHVSIEYSIGANRSGCKYFMFNPPEL